MSGQDPATILIVDDDGLIRDGVAEVFERAGYRTAKAKDVVGMESVLAQDGADLVILDIMMPGEDGLSACRRLAAKGWPPVILLSALGDDPDRIVGLEIGADDYVPKPCNPRELVARARAVLRRSRDTEARRDNFEAMRFAGFKLHIPRRELTDPDGVLIALSTGEFRLLRAFVERPQRVLSRDVLLDIAFSNENDVFDRAVDVQVSRLRKKLEHENVPELIRTVRGEGYIFTTKPTPA